MPAVDLIVPGSLESLTGGYIYDRRILEGMASLGWTTRVHELDASFPKPSAAALESADRVLGSLAKNSAIVIDGLALSGLRKQLAKRTDALDIVALIHHPLSLETGLDAATAAELARAEREALARVPHVIVTSPWTQRELKELGVAPERIAVVEPGCDPAPLAPRRRRGPLRILLVGTVTPRKGHALLVDALAALDSDAWQLRCAGSLDRDPETAGRLRGQIERQGLDERIELLGELEPEAVAREYADADLCVLPSYLEGFGMVITEAVARGLPIVSTRTGAIPDTLPAGAGLLVPPGDVAALSAALAELLRDRSKLDAMADESAAARRRLRSWAEASLQFANVLRGWFPDA